MQSITLLILGCLVGSLIKLADDISDKNLRINRLFAIPFGVIYGSLMGYMMISDIDASLIFGGIILGCLISGKINSTGHYFGLAAILAIVFLNSVRISPLVFTIATFASLDEMGEKIHIPGLDILFKYRLFLKIWVFLLFILDLTGFNGLLLLFAFDFAYIFTGRLDSRFVHEI
ncbi:MAG: hypothetical protein FIB07_00615 [Candidatus Methanoperedens sp.]|nr:hypothetical protein [Candidatus Methanoperedens sp.]